MVTTINAVFDAVLSRRHDGFKASAIQRKVEKRQKRPVPSETVKRALRQLRSEGYIDYTFDTKTGIYRA
jgi:Fe2+ or Zn2+ uptake regulation protein